MQWYLKSKKAILKEKEMWETSGPGWMSFYGFACYKGKAMGWVLTNRLKTNEHLKNNPSNVNFFNNIFSRNIVRIFRK